MDFSWARGPGAGGADRHRRRRRRFMQLARRTAKTRCTRPEPVRRSATPTCAQVRRDKLARLAARGDDDHARTSWRWAARRRRADWTSLSERREEPRVAAALAGGAHRRSTTASTRCALRLRLRRLRRRGRGAARAAASPTIRRSPNMDPEAIRQQLRKDIFLAVTLHEVGPQHGPAPQLPRLVRRDELLPAVLGPPLRRGQEREREEVRRLRCGTGIAADRRAPTTRHRPRGTSPGAPRARCGRATSTARAAHRRSTRSCGDVREYQYSSIMDYGAEFNSDLRASAATTRRR